MEDFTNPNLQLVLGIKEGTHFDRVQKSTVVIATLNSQCRETKKIQPDCSPQYATDLTWDTDKVAFREMRCNQTPIKVECYAVNENDSREKLGYILLSVRCAQIIHQGEETNIKTNWHTVLGVRKEFNSCKPKLLLYLIIKEKDSKPSNLIVKHTEPNHMNSIYSNIIPEWIKEENLIQLGLMETCQDVFLLNITTEFITNLNQAFQEAKENTSNQCILTYNIFNILIKLKPFRPESNIITLNEKVVIKIRTSLPVLLNYLITKSHFIVKLKCNNQILGSSEIDLKTLINSINLQEFKKINENLDSGVDYNCVLRKPYLKEISEDLNRDEDVSKLPFLKISVRLQHIELKEFPNEKNTSCIYYSPQLNLTKTNTAPVIKQYNYTEAQNHNQDKGIELTLQHYNNRHPEKYSNEMMANQSYEKLDNSQSKHTTFSVQHPYHTTQNKFESIDTYKSYSLNIYVNNIKFLESKSDIKNIEFRFYHSQGELITAICKSVSIVENQTIVIRDVKCSLHFISSIDGIRKLLAKFTPKININDATSDERKCISQVSLLDIEKLFSTKTHSYQYEAILTDCQGHKEIGFINILVKLEDFSSSQNIKKGNKLLDNSLAYEIVDELETWKERQKEIYKNELRKKEEAHLTLLNEEWQRRKKCLEGKLINSVEQCKTLYNNLNVATENLRQRKVLSLEKETKLIQANEEMQWKYDRKLHQLQDALRKMHEEFSAKLISLEEQNRNLISQIESLNEKKFELEKIKNDQAEKLDSFKKASLTEDQTTSILQQLKSLEEKLDNAQKSKSFFKEQWSKAVKEIHRIKMENQHAIESQIKSSKEELNNLDLEEILQAGSTALTYDQIALNQIQREIDIMNPESTSQYFKTNLNEQLFVPQSELCLNLDQNIIKSDTSTSVSSSSDRKLHMLIDERDTLLKTGNFTSKDSTIIKLNAEIRSILMSS